MPGTLLPYWQVNVPTSLREEACPKYLLNISEKDKQIIATPDEGFKHTSWSEVKSIIHENRIDLFQRKPSELRKYRAYTYKLAQEYGSVMEFVLKERLQWNDLTPGSSPFDDPDDSKILYNDWPYGVDPAIVHLVVWTKFDLEDDPNADDLTPAARMKIDQFVEETFCKHVPVENVIWFRNWRSLKSVHAVEHFHIMLNRPHAEFIKRITNGDVPLAAKVGIAASSE